MRAFTVDRIAPHDPGLNGAELWRVDLDASREPPDEAVQDLTDDERDRLARYRQVGDRARFACLRAALRRELGTRFGLAPRAVPIRIDPRGLPYLDGGSVRFNLAHSGDHGLIGMHAAARIGVDLEMDRHLDRLDTVAKIVLSFEEHALWLSRPTAEHRALLLRAWTAKEAILKALGVGLASDPMSFHVLGKTDELSPRGSVAGHDLQSSGTLLRALAVPAGYVAAVALLA